MLSNRLQDDLLSVTSTLKQDISNQLVDTSDALLLQCRAITACHDHHLKPKETEIYQAALLYLKGEIGEDIEYLYNLVGFGLYVPIESLGDKRVVDDTRKLEILLKRYRDEAHRGELWEMTWYSVLQAYFQPLMRSTEQAMLLTFLQETFADVASYVIHQPLWMKVLEKNPGLLTRKPCHGYVEDWLSGHEAPLKKIMQDMHVADDSWFWLDLAGACIKYAADQPDEHFKTMIPKLLSILRDKPAVLDEGLGAILYRYNQCVDKSVHEDLKNFALHHWKNPKLKGGGGTKWQRVQETVWQMMVRWVNDAYLRMFFERISARYGASKDRLSSWLRYIAWTKLTSDYETSAQQQSDPEILRLFQIEELALYACDETRDMKLDIFLAQIKDHLTAANITHTT